MTFEDWMVSVYQGQHSFKNPEQALRSAWDAGAAAEREAIKQVAEQELLNTSSLMSMPPQSSAAWNILNAISARGRA